MVIQVGLGNSANESATILDDSVSGAYNDSIKGFNQTLREYLGKYGQSDGQLTGSSPLMQVHLLNSGILPRDTRIVIRSELETAISRADSFLSGFYTDFGLALKTAGDSYVANDLPAKILAEDLEKRGIKLGDGKLIPFGVLTTEENTNSAYGGVFRLNDIASKNNILDLANFKWNFSRNEGLACAGLGRYRYWDSSVRLGGSSGLGRVVVVSGEATSQKILGRYSTDYQAERDRKIAEAEKEHRERVGRLRVN